VKQVLRGGDLVQRDGRQGGSTGGTGMQHDAVMIPASLKGPQEKRFRAAAKRAGRACKPGGP
jgi:hypothetical protein